MTRENLIYIAEEFNEWLEDISEKYQADKNDVCKQLSNNF